MKGMLDQKIVCYRYYNATTHIIFRNYDNEKGFKRHTIISCLGVKNTLLCTLCRIAQGMSNTHAASRTKSTSLKSNAPHVYVVKKGDTLWDISGNF
jgi:hypothetical protein